MTYRVTVIIIAAILLALAVLTALAALRINSTLEDDRYPAWSADAVLVAIPDDI